MNKNMLTETNEDLDLDAIDQDLEWLTKNKGETDEPGSFHCDVCTERFDSILHLRQHRKLHSHEELCRCYVCNKIYSTRWNLKQHFLIHFNAKPFRCDPCNLRFRQKEHLKKHASRVHRSTFVSKKRGVTRKFRQKRKTEYFTQISPVMISYKSSNEVVKPIVIEKVPISYLEPEGHYIPDKRSNNVISKESIVPPTNIEKKQGYCLRTLRLLKDID